MKTEFVSSGSALSSAAPSLLSALASAPPMPPDSASKSNRSRRKRTTSVSAGKERTAESVESVSVIDNSIDVPEELPGYPVEQCETPEDIARDACLETTPSEDKMSIMPILPDYTVKNQSNSKKNKVSKSETGATAQSTVKNNKKRTHKMKTKKAKNLEAEISDLI